MNKNTKSCLLLRLAMIEGAYSLQKKYGINTNTTLSNNKELADLAIKKNFISPENNVKMINYFLDKLSELDEECCCANQSKINCSTTFDSCSKFNNFFIECIDKYVDQNEGIKSMFDTGLF